MSRARRPSAKEKKARAALVAPEPKPRPDSEAWREQQSFKGARMMPRRPRKAEKKKQESQPTPLPVMPSTSQVHSLVAEKNSTRMKKNAATIDAARKKMKNLVKEIYTSQKPDAISGRMRAFVKNQWGKRVPELQQEI